MHSLSEDHPVLFVLLCLTGYALMWMVATAVIVLTVVVVGMELGA